MKNLGLLISCFLVLMFSQAQNPATIKVITYNIYNGFDFGKDTLRRNNFQAWIHSQKPDILALQELCSYTPEKLQQEAMQWGHPYSVLLKTTGYSVGITSRYPIEIKEKILEGMHHGALHCKIKGIDLMVVHLHPGSINRRREESKILVRKIEAIRNENPYYMVVGDFNAHSPFDADLYNPDSYFMNRLRMANEGKGLDGNVADGGLDYAVISSFLSFLLVDVVQRFTKGLARRGSFPTLILGPVNKETDEQLRERMERIDYIFVSPALAVRCTNAGICNGKENGYLSDHYPAEAEFEVLN